MESKARRVLVFMGLTLALIGMSWLGPEISSRPLSADRRLSSAHPLSVHPATGGLRACIDPVTGERVAEPSFPPLPPSEALSQSAAGLTIVHRPNGSKHLDLRGRFMVGTFVRVGSDGAKQYCVTSPAQVEPLQNQSANPVLEEK
jgi:hypothetical protein